MNRVREPFQSILNDLRDATQTLANCAAKGPLQKDGTRKPMLYICWQCGDTGGWLDNASKHWHRCDCEAGQRLEEEDRGSD